MSGRAVLLAAGLMIVPVSAQACIQEPVPEALIFERKPDAQADAFLVKARVVGDPLAEQPRIRVLEGPRDLLGRVLELQPEQWSSCLSLGRLTGYVQVRRVSSEGRTVRLTGIAFRRSWRDWLVHLFGAAPYGYPGERVRPAAFHFNDR